MSATVEVADIFRIFGAAYRAAYGGQTSREQRRAMRAIEGCRTAELGGHVDECDACGHVRISYNSCRNRHCPKCQTLDKERWREAQAEALLPIPYFHVVFTLPEALGPLALRNPQVFYSLLFKAASETLLALSRDPQHLGAQIGITALLHTWSQTLMHHPHLHCIVTGGGLSEDGHRWIESRKDFFLPVQVVSRLFRGKLLAYLKQAYQADALIFPGAIAAWQDDRFFQKQLTVLYQKEWVVYCKPPLGRPEQVLEYLARYTHRVALTNDRILRVEGDRVTFRYRDSQDQNRIKEMTLEAVEFIRRFLLHVLPDHFVKIRHYGILSNRKRKVCVRRCKALLGMVSSVAEGPTPRSTWQEILERLTGIDPMRCPHCGNGKMVTRHILLPLEDRSPPQAERMAM